MKIVVIEPTGSAYTRDATFEDCRTLVGGDVEAIGFGGAMAYLNENGKAEGLPYNEWATRLSEFFQVGLQPGDYIVGTMILVGCADDDGNETDVPAELAAEVKGLTLAFVVEGGDVQCP